VQLASTAQRDFRDRLDTRRATLLESLENVSHGESLCSLSRRRVPAVKYLEGALSVVGDLRRQPSSDPGSELDEVCAVWNRRVERMPDADDNWRGYFAGALDELDALRQALAG
jgi:hypothetical protein